MKRTPKAFVAVFSLLLVLSDSGKAQNFIVENFNTEGQARNPRGGTNANHNVEWIRHEDWVATPFITDTIPENHWYEVVSLDVFGAEHTFRSRQVERANDNAVIEVRQDFIPQFFIYESAAIVEGVNFVVDEDQGQDFEFYANRGLQVPTGRHIQFDNLIPDPLDREYRPYEIVSELGDERDNFITRARFFPINNPDSRNRSQRNIRLEGDTAYWLVAGMPPPIGIGNPTEDSPHTMHLFHSLIGIRENENGQWDILPETSGGRNFQGGLFSTTQGTQWSAGGNRDHILIPFVLQFGIQANLVPEPSATLPVVALALCISAIVLRKMRKPVRSA